MFWYVLLVVLVLSLHVENLNVLLVQGAREAHLSVYPRGCDKSAAAQCEYEFLLCKLFNGPANDQATLCNCAKDFYGSCLRLAGVSKDIFLKYDVNQHINFVVLYLLFLSCEYSVKLRTKWVP